MLYYLWRQESDLLRHDDKYSTKLEESSVRLIVQRNQSAFELFSEAVDEAIHFVNSNPQLAFTMSNLIPFMSEKIVMTKWNL